MSSSAEVRVPPAAGLESPLCGCVETCQSRLMRLPTELRKEILRHLLCHCGPLPFVLRTNGSYVLDRFLTRFTVFPAILRASHQLCADGTPILYGENSLMIQLTSEPNHNAGIKLMLFAEYNSDIVPADSFFWRFRRVNILVRMKYNSCVEQMKDAMRSVITQMSNHKASDGPWELRVRVEPQSQRSQIDRKKQCIACGDGEGRCECSYRDERSAARYDYTIRGVDDVLGTLRFLRNVGEIVFYGWTPRDDVELTTLIKSSDKPADLYPRFQRLVRYIANQSKQEDYRDAAQTMEEKLVTVAQAVSEHYSADMKTEFNVCTHADCNGMGKYRYEGWAGDGVVKMMKRAMDVGNTEHFMLMRQEIMDRVDYVHNVLKQRVYDSD